jgi:hypothetical protein
MKHGDLQEARGIGPRTCERISEGKFEGDMTGRSQVLSETTHARARTYTQTHLDSRSNIFHMRQETRIARGDHLRNRIISLCLRVHIRLCRKS